MSDVLVDAGPLVAYLDNSERRHAMAREALGSWRGRWRSTWPVLTEAEYLLQRPAGRANLIELVRREAVVPYDLDKEAIASMAAYQAKYRDRNPDLADLSLVAAADALGIRTVFTFDSDFLVYRTRKGRAFSCPLLDLIS
jgi:predicted nucleic acid-binding protein